MINYRLSLIGAVVAVSLFLYISITGFDFFELVAGILWRYEHFELDEYVIPLSIFSHFFLLDLLLKQRKQKIEKERSEIYEAMLFTNYHIMNNFLNNMQLFKLTAENVPEFPKDVLENYDRIIKETQKQLCSLKQIENIDKKSIKASVIKEINESQRSVS